MLRLVVVVIEERAQRRLPVERVAGRVGVLDVVGELAQGRGVVAPGSNAAPWPGTIRVAIAITRALFA